MSTDREYLCELESTEEDIRVWKSEKKVRFLEDRGYKIWQDVEVSLRKWMMFYNLADKNNNSSYPPTFYLNDCE